MLQFLAIAFFLIGMILPLALIAMMLQKSGRAILDALGAYERRPPHETGSLARIRPRPAAARAARNPNWRAAA